ncbi:hypothetical protein AJ85_16100 [Alkalihalobacillus alcalophilus ATCC 27647 = CGMCC 1.3604]|uniref:Uncharacterized protein n=1 Tax=Alkalihalobacillus alcalophilus ATCC 27647 = CGMCC 1.3604 TaxID=1218173 RepID=A0A4S4K571_ALKAL|nr:pyridoxamine 5'-phosphate oxidase family protein [Alkalihalobacillus alcalophilus]THG92197.1 hypothetical protein AJ85_16100 [Alkalihalobacillus alcalophilus ATCC 27647 = CGMCC 1.3604]
MHTSEIKKEILNILDKDKIGTLATVVNNKPQSRFMSFYHDQFTLYTPTDLDTLELLAT